MPRRRAPVHAKLKLESTHVQFRDGSTNPATREGNNAAWHCHCEAAPLLTGRCYYQFGDTCYTECPSCKKRFRVLGDAKKRATYVEEEI